MNQVRILAVAVLVVGLSWTHGALAVAGSASLPPDMESAVLNQNWSHVREVLTADDAKVSDPVARLLVAHARAIQKLSGAVRTGWQPRSTTGRRISGCRDPVSEWMAQWRPSNSHRATGAQRRGCAQRHLSASRATRRCCAGSDYAALR